jgi:single-strand DNA-binding protein
MYNKVVLVGNLTRDVEIRYSQGGAAIGKVGIATSHKWKSQTGEQKEEVMFIELTFFGRTAEVANQYLRKGSKVLVDGRLVLEQWTAQDGSKRSKHSITVESMKMLDNKGDNPGGQGGGYGGGQQQSSGGYNNQQSAPAQQSQQQQYQAPQHQAPQHQNDSAPAHKVPEIDIDEDEIPF